MAPVVGMIAQGAAPQRNNKNGKVVPGDDSDWKAEFFEGEPGVTNPNIPQRTAARSGSENEENKEGGNRTSTRIGSVGANWRNILELVDEKKQVKSDKFLESLHISPEQLEQADKIIRETNTDDETEPGTWEKIRKPMYDLFEEPSSSTAAYILAVVILVLIILSSITFCAETVEEINENYEISETIRVLDTIFIVCFTAEYVLRLVVAPDTIAFIVNAQNLIDLIAILPYFLEKIIDAVTDPAPSPPPPAPYPPSPDDCDSHCQILKFLTPPPSPAGTNVKFDLRFLRLARVFRVFKLSRYGNRMQMVVDALTESREILAMLAVNLIILIVVFSSITYYAEQTDPETSFASIPHTCWWCIVTVLTVGYGDMSPQTLGGKLIASLLMVCSLIVLALPITIIGSCFSNSWMAYKEEQKALERLTQLPDQFKDLYPKLLQFTKLYREHLQSFRERSLELKHHMKKIKQARKQRDVPAIQKYLVSLAASRTSVGHHLDDAVAQTSTAFDEVLFELVEQQKMHTFLQAQAGEMMKVSDILYRVCMADMLNLERGSKDFGPNQQHRLKDFQTAVVIHVIGARNLVPCDMNGSSDPFVKVSFDLKGISHKKQASTKVCARSLNPMFDEYMLFMLKSLEGMLQFEVFDHDKLRVGKSQFMGSANVKLSALQNDHSVSSVYPDYSKYSKWLKLEGVKTGDLKVDIVVRPADSVKPEEIQNPEVLGTLFKILTDPEELEPGLSPENSLTEPPKVGTPVPPPPVDSPGVVSTSIEAIDSTEILPS